MIENAFDKLAPFIQDYIYNHNWQELRDVQVASCDVIFNTDDNLLIAAGTASGKTEATFLPILTDLYNNPSNSVGVLYISPLKALINDQFVRLDGLLEESHIPVCRWHGDVSANIKKKFLDHPQGVMQTTPESLEALISNKRQYALILFSDLRYIVIDEMHYFMESNRGLQLLSILERIGRLTKNIPRRVGLSATLGDYTQAKQWLSLGTPYKTIVPELKVPPRTLKISLAYLPMPVDENGNVSDECLNQLENTEYYQYLYATTDKKKCIIFANSRAESEINASVLNKINDKSGGSNIYMVHHGSINNDLREHTEQLMKQSSEPMVVSSTVTLELGIDIGGLQRVVQTGSPFTVSSFVQRLGRSGRQNGVSEMCFLFNNINEGFYKDIFLRYNWSLIKCIAIAELYIKERWIEPLNLPTLPFGILYHQTMSTMKHFAELSPAGLAQQMLTNPVFSKISQDDFKTFLRNLIQIDHLEISENNTLLVGEAGEKVINRYDFLAVFQKHAEYSVRCGSQEIGTVAVKFPVDEVFVLAGSTWIVTAVDDESFCIYVEPIKGVSTNIWPGGFPTNVWTKLMKKIRDILVGNEEFAYLTEKAKNLLNQYRFELANCNILQNKIVQLTNGSVAIFPWLGSKAMLALCYYFRSLGFECKIHNVWNLPLYLQFDNKHNIADVTTTFNRIKQVKIDKNKFQIDEKDVRQILDDKFDKYVEPSLLTKQIIADYIDVDDLVQNC